MTIFQSIKEIFNALSSNYQSNREIAQRAINQQESMLNEAKHKVLLERQLKEYIEFMRTDGTIAGLWVDIAFECIPYIDDISSALSLECSITPGGEEGRYLLQLVEEEL